MGDDHGDNERPGQAREQARDQVTDPWGIEPRYHDAFGVERETSDETRAEILRAMGVDPQAPGEPARADVRVIRPGPGGDTRALAGAGGGKLHLEGGGTVAVGPDGRAPDDLPLGYHRFTAAGAAGPDALVIASPGSCFLPDDLRTWGWAVQLYAARSRESWGIGDLGDLRAVGAWTRQLGGGALMINPLTAPAPAERTEPSPYYPSSRRFRSPLYLRIEEVPGAPDAGEELGRLAAEARALNAERRIDRDRILPLKMRALELLWERFGGQRLRDNAALDEYRRSVGDSLNQFAAYCTLAERHGKDWRAWPAGLRHPAGAEVRDLIAHDRRVAFHCWVQWLLDAQLARASADVRVFHDLPVGFDVAGADGWCWQDLVAADISVGCPPDAFNLDGQDWGLAPFIPTKLRAAGYLPFIDTIRAMLRHAGGLRIDHVMGLFRLFWIPRRLGAKGGTYVRSAPEEMLAIVDLESARARAVIVGEDLGTVLPGTREVLAAHKLLSYRLLFFEPGAPPTFPELALSSVTTHDLATIAGIWTGASIDHMASAGVTPNTEGLRELKDKLARLSGVAPDAPLDEVAVAVYRALAAAPSRVLLATLDDALGVLEQPNMPGTTTSWPNWSLALPQSLEQLREAELPKKIAAVLRARP